MSCLLFQAMVSHMSSAVGAFQKNSLQEKRRLGGLDFRKNQLPPKEEKREGKRKKTKCQHIIVERIGCRLVALGQSFSLFIKTGRDRRTIHQDKWWSMVITETRIPRTKIQKPRSRTFPRRSKWIASGKLFLQVLFFSRSLWCQIFFWHTFLTRSKLPAIKLTVSHTKNIMLF